jgi:hypothetical protein
MIRKLRISATIEPQRAACRPSYYARAIGKERCNKSDRSALG